MILIVEVPVVIICAIWCNI